MTDIRDIPGETRWRFAADFAAYLPFLYDAAFRPVIGERYDEIEQEVWMELSRTAFAIARDLSLPTETAQDLAETMRIVMVILFGPGFRKEALKVSPDKSVILVKQCPLIEQAATSGSAGNPVFRRCMAFTLTAVPLLNNKYSARFVRTMCTGDRQCEIKIEKAGELVTDTKKK
ncbi:MAG: hypothetical protein ABSG49_06640 [Methanoregula sp.]|jgi:hypothetical protein|uniref:hypothetical protein n=1 Tax=Methanoregula sp. TaxID=2052170 RepID=UPI003C14B613